ncbi:MAG: hypothetical protein LBT25_02575 [Candidatus Symbiothrix sp.]|jgi:chromosome segregation ATPase|nr:hypothetical protein [Candidatus Symbiothrix sp.]
MKNKQTLWIVIVVALLLIVIVAVLFIFQQRKQMQDLQLQSELTKDELADDYNELSIQYEGYKLTINNDSLLAKLETEQMKVQRLQEELRTIKSTNIKRINELKKELETLRVILQNYVQQIDSLNKINEKLTVENKQVTAKYRQATQTVSQLSQEKEQLAETVQLAAKLDASNISVIGITDKNKKTDKIKNMDQLEVHFTINRNITAPPGEKTIYLRIQKPDDDVLIKSRSNVFMYEDKEINYSVKRDIEYMGEEIEISIYWKVEEFLTPGTYRVDIFADGNRIGQKSFRLEK